MLNTFEQGIYVYLIQTHEDIASNNPGYTMCHLTTSQRQNR